MKKQITMKHRRDVLISKLEDLDDQISEKEQLMRDRGHGDIIEGQPNHRSLYTVYWTLYGSRSLRNLYFKRKSLQAKLNKCDQHFIKKEKAYNDLLINAPQLSFPTSEEMNQLMPNDLKQDDDRMANEYFHRQEEEQWHYSQQNSL